MSRTFAAPTRRWLTRHRWRRYLREVRRPLVSLVFLLPAVLLFEVSSFSGGASNLLAHSMIRGLFQWFGIGGSHLPSLALVLALLVWHVQRGDRLRILPWVPAGMLVESLVLAIPLLVFASFFAPTATPTHAGLYHGLVGGLGAALYEEFVFRFTLILGFAWVGRRSLQMRPEAAYGFSVTLAAVLFAACHYVPIGAEPFRFATFFFRAAGGVYLGLLFLRRGFGIAAGTHAAFNLLLVLWRGVW